MLAIEKKRQKRSFFSKAAISFAALLLIGGLYTLSLVVSPTVAPLVAAKPINVTTLPTPKHDDNRIIIPKIGVDIAYAPGAASLDRGAQWRYPENGSPDKGGNFIIAAHRFSIQPTPQSTVEKSPFYNIDKLAVGDKIIVDHLGNRYAYEINKVFDAQSTEVEVEAKSTEPKLTLYSCELGGAKAGRVVITASPMGKVAVTSHTQAN